MPQLGDTSTLPTLEMLSVLVHTRTHMRTQLYLHVHVYGASVYTHVCKRDPLQEWGLVVMEADGTCWGHGSSTSHRPESADPGELVA